MAEDRILFCRCARSAVVPADVQAAVLAGLAAAAVPVTAVEDLCGRCATRDPSLLALAEQASTLTVVACHPRAVRWLLHAAGVQPGHLRVLDMRTQTAAAILHRSRRRRLRPPPKQRWPRRPRTTGCPGSP